MIILKMNEGEDPDSLFEINEAQIVNVPAWENEKDLINYIAEQINFERKKSETFKATRKKGILSDLL